MASSSTVGGWLVAAALTMVCVASLWSQPAVAPQDELAAGSEPGALFTRYCIGCHNTRLRTAGLAIDELDLALESLNTDRSVLGSTISSLSTAVTNLSTTVENYGVSMGQIRDADIGAESAEFARFQVLQQAGVAMLSQANALPNLALRLLG